jgi:hypothetical protein
MCGAPRVSGLTSLISEVKSLEMWCAAHATGNRLNGHLDDWASIASASVRAADDQIHTSVVNTGVARREAFVDMPA